MKRGGQPLLVPKPDEEIVCSWCGAPLPMKDVVSEDGALDFPYCESCQDFVDPKVRKKNGQDAVDV